MKILWVNPSFLDYRIPVYKYLNELSGGHFYILFSKNRVPERIPIRIKAAIGDNAIVFEGEKRITLGQLERGMSNKSISFPVTRGLYKTVKSVCPDVIIAEGFFQWTPMAIRYAIFHRRPLLIDYERTKWTERDCPKWRTLYRKIVDKFTRGYLCNGSQTKEYLIDIIGVDPQKIVTGTISADSENLRRQVDSFKEQDKESLILDLGLNSLGLTYIYVGQIVERKGLKYVLDVWDDHLKDHKNDNLLIIGEGELLEHYENKYGKLYGVHFIGPVTYDIIYKYYAVSNVLIIPTLEDNWSLVVPEAMACGLPVATSIYNGCYPELCREGINGKTFDPFKKESIIEVLNYFHLIDCEAFGRSSIEIEKEYSYDKAASRIFDKCLTIYNRQNK